jgi:hypothetical protein
MLTTWHRGYSTAIETMIPRRKMRLISPRPYVELNIIEASAYSAIAAGGIRRNVSQQSAS